MRLTKMICFQGFWLIFAVLIKIHLSECTFHCTILPGVQNLAKQPSSVKAFLNCSFDRIIVGAVNWTRKGQPVEEGNILADPHVNKTWSAVVLPDLSFNQDVGEFTCAAKSGQEVSSCSTPTSPSKPKLLKLESVKIVENGRSPEMSCRASGWPTPRVSWWRNGSRIRDGNYHNSYSLSYSADNIVSITIVAIDGYHHGTYTCRADNSFGTSVADITLMVKRTDMIENKYDVQFPNIALEGNNITLECICRKKECKENTANVYWKFKGHYVNQSARLVLTKTALANSEKILMTILNASKVDEGRYFCGINTSRGFEERPRKLRVLKKDRFQIGSPSQDVSAKLRSHLMLRCYAIYPSVLTKTPETFWRVNNTSIPKDSQHYQQKEFRPRNELNSTTSLPYELHISNFSVQDVGWYLCGVKFRKVSYVVTTNISLSLKMEKTEETNEDAKQAGSKNSPLIAISSITAGGIIMGFVVAFLAYRLCRNKSNTDEPFFETKVNGRQFRYDVFVTFSSQDLNWVRKELIPLVEKNKLNYCIHDRDFEIGKPVVDNMAESVYTSRKVLAVMSHNYMSSKFCRGELEMALYRSTEMGDSSVIVMRIDGVDRSKLPKALRNRTFLDYHDFSERKNWEERLIKHLKPPPIDKCPEKNSGKLYSKLPNTEV